MMDDRWFLAVRHETVERKERNACSNKVKVKDNSNGEEAEQRFSKQSHGELGLPKLSTKTHWSAMGL
jgi:hypothetical protein